MSRIVPDKCHGFIDMANSSTTPLAGGAVFTGGAVSTLDYGIIYISIHTDQPSATDGLIIEQSSDGVNFDQNDVFTIIGITGRTFSINPHALYYRIRYINGAVAQTFFRLQSILKVIGKSSTHRIQDQISLDDDAELNKSVITGENPQGNFVNFRATRHGNFRVSIEEYGDTTAIDAFDRLRVSFPFTLFDSKQLHDKQPLFFDESIGGSATSTHVPTNAAVSMTVTASASDFVIRQTKQRFNYQPGKGQMALFTFRATQQTGVTKRIGLFDGTGANYLTPRNGIYLEITGTAISFNVAKNGSTTETVTQNNWNVDKLDGTGSSGITLNLNAPQIFICDFEWLGVGRIRCGFIIQGIIRYCHYFFHANNTLFSAVYMSTPNLPIRYGIQGSASGGGSLDHICSTVMSEGGQEQTGILRSVNTNNVHIDANTADQPYAVIGLRLKAAYYDIVVYPEYISMISETNDDFRWSLLLNPTISGTFTYNDITNSACQYALGATANTITALGLIIDSGYAKQGASLDRRINTSLRIGSTIAGVMDTLVISVTPLSSNADYQASLTFRELL